MKTKNLSEIVDLQESVGSAQIDETAGIVRGVVILTGNKKSRNKTLYTDPALAEAVTRYEGAKMFLDHPKQGENNRSIRDLGGHYENVRRDGNFVRGDLHVLESFKSVIMPIAKSRMKGVGLSIKDKGHGTEKDGIFLVEGFQTGNDYSIDFVSEISVNNDLFEGHNNQEGGEDMNFKELSLDVLRKERPDLIESVQQEGKAGLLKDLEEAKKKGEKSDAVELKANKTLALCDAGFSKEVRESVQKMIEPEAINLDAAKAIITAQKEIVESLIKANSNGNPDVNAGGSRSLNEGAKDISDDEWANAVKKH